MEAILGVLKGGDDGDDSVDSRHDGDRSSDLEASSDLGA
jgi:hypothetical protein